MARCRNLPFKSVRTVVGRFASGCRWVFLNGFVLLAAGLCLPLWFPPLLASPMRLRFFWGRLGWPADDRAGSRGPVSNTLWVHALSVGEVRAAQTLIEGMRRKATERIVVSATTMTGFALAQRLFEPQGIEVHHFPYDWVVSLRAAARRIAPRRVILVESDIWPGFLSEMKRRGVPVYLVNWRLSEKTWRRFRRARPLARRMLEDLHRIGVQTARDRRRLIELGVDGGKVFVSGNIKFDIAEPECRASTAAAWRQRLRLPAGRWVLVAGSTHPGEEAVVLSALRSISQVPDRSVLIFAPRDTARCTELLCCCRRQGLNCRLFSDNSCAAADVILINAIGLLKEIYSIADVAFIGGSLKQFGGHNPLEPAEWGKPVLFGPDMRDFASVAGEMVEGGGAWQVEDEQGLADCLQRLLQDPALARRMGGLALETVRANKGAVQQTLSALGLNRKDV